MKLLLPTVVFNLASVHGQDFGGMNIGAAPENMEFFDSLAGFAGVDQKDEAPSLDLGQSWLFPELNQLVMDNIGEDHLAQDEDTEKNRPVSLLTQKSSVTTEEPENNLDDIDWNDEESLEETFCKLLKKQGENHPECEQKEPPRKGLSGIMNAMRSVNGSNKISINIIVRVYYSICFNNYNDIRLDESSSEEEIAVAAEDLKFAKFLYNQSKAHLIPNTNAIRYTLMNKVLKKDPSEILDLARISGTSNTQNEPVERSIVCAGGGCMIPLSWQDIFGYGCWCNFRDSITQGGGPAVDPWDANCKRLQMCTKCIEIDAEAEGNSTCDLVSTDYTNNLQMDFNTMEITSNCEADNAGDSCAIGLCKCELQFYQGMQALISNQNVDAAQTHFKHENGFDRLDNANCKRTTHMGFRKESCCGVAPNRSPFNDFIQDCCDDEVRPYGSC